MTSVPESLTPITEEPPPKDGTRIVIWRENYGLYAVEWRDNAWTVRPGKTVPENEVTHWRHRITA